MFCWYIDCKNLWGMSNIKYIYSILIEYCVHVNTHGSSAGVKSRERSRDVVRSC